MHCEQCRGVFVAPAFPDYVPHGAKTLQRQIDSGQSKVSKSKPKCPQHPTGEVMAQGRKSLKLIASRFVPSAWWLP